MDALAPETFMGRHYLLFYAIIYPLNKNVLVSTVPTALVALEIDWRVGITSVEYGDSIQERVF